MDYESLTQKGLFSIPHSFRFVREFDMDFLGRWVGRDAQIPWPPHSPDIMPLDFFL
jgi:hypothetical protein